MQHIIKKYEVRLPLLRKYIRFFWELKIEQAALNHKIIPQRNINLRINLNETPHYASAEGKLQLLEPVNFSGLQDKNMNVHLKLSGNIHVLGICFYSAGFYPFFKIPVSEFKNQLLGADEIGERLMNEICKKLKETPDVYTRLSIIEHEFASMLMAGKSTKENFGLIFDSLSHNQTPQQISEFCNQNKISLRSLERMYSKYIGMPASTYSILNRFHLSTNQLLNSRFDKLSDLAFDNGYFDQMHFIRDFKRFAGSTPKEFIKHPASILQIGRLS